MILLVLNRNLTKHSSEVLFEVWDQLENSTEKFLGLGIGLSAETLITILQSLFSLNIGADADPQPASRDSLARSRQFQH